MMGENVACGNSGAKETFLQWYFSASHLKNMVNPAFQHMGIARAGSGDENCPFYWTNDFGAVSFEKMNDPLPDSNQIKAAYDKIMGSVSSD
jgi:Cysteine-rich secretory protein family